MTLARLVGFAQLPRPLLWGHRGSREGMPENSLGAIEHAATAGADGVEIDVRSCASGELVLLHDPDLGRVTGGQDVRAVAAVPYATLQRTPLGQGQVVPRLEAVLELCQKRGLHLNVELKADVPDRRALVARAARLLDRHDPAHAVVVSCFDLALLLRFRALAPAVPVALLVARPPPLRLGRGRALGALAAHGLGHWCPGMHAVHVDRAWVSRPRVQRWHRRGLRVHVWTVNEAAELAALVRLGVDGIITDEPARMRAAMLGALSGSPRTGGARPPARAD